MRPGPGQVLHFSEDPTITRFVPHVAATAQQPDAYVWAVDHDRAPGYWFPRQCPRAMAWVRAGTTDSDRVRIIGADCGARVHAIEYGWLEAMRTVRLFAYRLPANRFRAAAFGTDAYRRTADADVTKEPLDWCEAHDIVPKAQGGLTSLDNMVMLCGFHHRLVHRTSWQVRLGHDRFPEFVPPQHIDGQRRARRNLYHRRT